MVGPGVNGYDPALDKRFPVDIAGAKKLLADAGYPDGFEVGFDCPNDRYVNDEAMCQAVVAMLARIGIKANLLAQTRAKYFGKINAPDFDTSFYMLGWTPGTYDALDCDQGAGGDPQGQGRRVQYRRLLEPASSTSSPARSRSSSTTASATS